MSVVIAATLRLADYTDRNHWNLLFDVRRDVSAVGIGCTAMRRAMTFVWNQSTCLERDTQYRPLFEY